MLKKLYKDFKSQKPYALSVLCSFVLTITMGITFQSRVEEAQKIQEEAQKRLSAALVVENAVKERLEEVNHGFHLIEQWNETQKFIVKDLEDIHRELGLVSEIKQNRLENRLNAIERKLSKEMK